MLCAESTLRRYGLVKTLLSLALVALITFQLHLFELAYILCIIALSNIIGGLFLLSDNFLRLWLLRLYFKRLFSGRFSELSHWIRLHFYLRLQVAFFLRLLNQFLRPNLVCIRSRFGLRHICGNFLHLMVSSNLTLILIFVSLSLLLTLLSFVVIWRLAEWLIGL